MLKCALLTLGMITTLLARAEAQSEWLGRPPGPDDSVSHSISEAEARGVRHPPAVLNNVRDTSFINNHVGSRQRRCVNADAAAVRSGDFVAGPFSLYSEIWRQGYGKLWWHPIEMPPEVPLLTVHAARLDQQAEGRIFESPDIAWPPGPYDSAGKIIKFYPTGIRLPTVGRWLMVATAGNNWGCFILTVE